MRRLPKDLASKSPADNEPPHSRQQTGRRLFEGARQPAGSSACVRGKSRYLLVTEAKVTSAAKRRNLEEMK